VVSVGPPTPPWLAALIAALAEPGEATGPILGELARLGNAVPFRAVYDWHAYLFGDGPGDVPEAVEAPGAAVVGLCHRAARGERVEVPEWRAALRPALRALYRSAYPYAEAHRVAYANAHAYATANGYQGAEIVEFAEYYARLSTDANAEAYAEANAIANADALATALATADERAYAGTYPAALLRARTLAAVAASDVADLDRAARIVQQRMAQAMADVLSRLPA
jgi:hypothetical protein